MIAEKFWFEEHCDVFAWSSDKVLRRFLNKIFLSLLKTFKKINLKDLQNSKTH